MAQRSQPKPGKGDVGPLDQNDSLPAAGSEHPPGRELLREVLTIWEGPGQRDDHMRRTTRMLASYTRQVILDSGAELPLLLRLTGTSSRAWEALIYVHSGGLLESWYEDYNGGELSSDDVVTEIRNLANSLVYGLIKAEKTFNNDKAYDNILDTLPFLLEVKLADELKKRGVADVSATSLAREITAEFSQAHSVGSVNTLDGAVALALSAFFASKRLLKADPLTQDGATPEKWVDRDPKQFPTAESFLRHHYGSRLGIDGDLTQAELGRIDAALLTALARQFRGRRDELNEVLPTVASRSDAKLLREFGYVPKGEDRKRKLTALSRRTTASLRP